MSEGERRECYANFKLIVISFWREGGDFCRGKKVIIKVPLQNKERVFGEREKFFFHFIENKYSGKK